MSQPKKYLSQWKVEELKTALEDLGLDTTGKRPDLYKRLKDALGKGPSQSQTPNPSVHDDQELLKFNQGPVFKRIPKAARHSASVAFRKTIQNMIDENVLQTWANHFSFPRAAIGPRFHLSP